MTSSNAGYSGLGVVTPGPGEVTEVYSAKNAEELLYKYKNLCETNDSFIFNESIDQKYLDLESIKKKISSGEDIIGRNDSFKKIRIDNSFPRYILKNISLYKDWIAN